MVHWASFDIEKLMVLLDCETTITIMMKELVKYISMKIMKQMNVQRTPFSYSYQANTDKNN